MKILEAIAAMAAGCATAGCVHSAATDSSGEAEGADTLPVAVVLPMPEIPDLLTGREARADYAAERFFRPLAVADTSEAMEQNLANYAAVAADADASVRRRAFADMWSKTPQPMFDRLAAVVEDYYYNPESPVYSSDLLLDALKAAEQLGLIGEGDRWLWLIDELRHNAPGSMAADFAYTDTDGDTHRLLEPGPTQMLIFYDPECEHCSEEITCLAQNEEIRTAIRTRHLRVTAIYPGGDYGLWKSHAGEIPESWTNGMNRDNPIGTQDGFMIKMTPHIYLIQSDGKVGARDLTARTAAEYAGRMIAD